MFSYHHISPERSCFNALYNEFSFSKTIFKICYISNTHRVILVYLFSIYKFIATGAFPLPGAFIFITEKSKTSYLGKNKALPRTVYLRGAIILHTCPSTRSGQEGNDSILRDIYRGSPDNPLPTPAE